MEGLMFLLRRLVKRILLLVGSLVLMLRREVFVDMLMSGFRGILGEQDIRIWQDT
jgi:hypothetical protein